MPTFAYKALTTTGEEIAADVEAADQAAAVRELLARGACVTDIRPAEGAFGGLLPGVTTAGRSRLRPKQLANLTRQLAITLDAGLPLMTALEVMGQELDQTAARELLRRLRLRVQQGGSLSEALAEHPDVFPPLYVRLVRVGETGGVLDAVLRQLADTLEQQAALRERVRSAAIYPAILLAVGVASVVIIVTVIVPRIIAALGTEPYLLPWPTRMLLAASGFIGKWWWLLGLGGVAAVVLWRQAVQRGPARRGWDALRLRLPLLGRLTQRMEAARFARNLGILTHAGVTITEALAVVQETVQNLLMRSAVQRVAESIKTGESIAQPLQRSALFPSLLIQMVRVGENTGRLDELLLRAADVHDAEATITLDRLVNVLPVLLILVLAGLIGFIVAGLVLAIVEFQTTGFGALG